MKDLAEKALTNISFQNNNEKEGNEIKCILQISKQNGRYST